MPGRSKFRPFRQSLPLQMLAHCGVYLICRWHSLVENTTVNNSDRSFPSVDRLEISYLDIISFWSLDGIFILCTMACFDKQEPFMYGVNCGLESVENCSTESHLFRMLHFSEFSIKNAIVITHQTEN